METTKARQKFIKKTIQEGIRRIEAHWARYAPSQKGFAIVANADAGEAHLTANMVAEDCAVILGCKKLGLAPFYDGIYMTNYILWLHGGEPELRSAWQLGVRWRFNPSLPDCEGRARTPPRGPYGYPKPPGSKLRWHRQSRSWK